MPNIVIIKTCVFTLGKKKKDQGVHFERVKANKKDRIIYR